jgi:type VI secretion system secreted protein VgrG
MATQTEVTPSLVYSQSGRAISVETVLGADKLLLESFDGEDEVAGFFRYTLRMLSRDANISSSKLIRTPATVRLAASDGSTRVVNGLISRFVQLEHEEGLTVYEAELRPWFWFLSLTSDFCTFQNMSIPTIVKDVCKEHGFQDIQDKLVKPHPKHEYRVQYRETHVAFLSRLMEEEGIFWFFEHDGKKCVLVLADDNSAAKQTAKLRMSTVAHETEDEVVLGSFTREEEVRPGKFTTVDYNFETPSVQLNQVAGKQQPEVVEFPGGFAKRDDGDRLARLRQEEINAEQVLARGSGRCRALRPGMKIELSNHLNKGFNGTYLVTSSRHSAKLADYRSGGDPGLVYSSSFTAIPFDTPYRPPRRTPLPRTYGYQSAIVVGPDGEEIYTDEYARVKVQFFWDRRGKKDDKSSCWVRVSTTWAGKGWGFVQIPRIGQEVLVDFLDGNPDRPIIIGRIWNAEHKPPYTLPDNKTQSGVKTRSALKGTPDNFNEIRFEDKKGSEHVYIHAEKDETTVVENDCMVQVGRNRTESVGKDEQIDIGHDRTEKVGNNESIGIAKNRTETVGDNESVNVGKNRNHSVGKVETLNVGDDRTISVGKKETISIGDTRSTTVGKNDELSVGKNFLLTAADEIVLKTGDAEIVMKKNGEIKIKGKDITIEGSGKINVKASSDVVIKGSKVTAN